jgi:hypothetical protein
MVALQIQIGLRYFKMKTKKLKTNISLTFKENMKKKRASESLQSKIKLFLMFSMAIFLIGIISASLGSYKQNECVQIKTILNSSAVNISSISYPNSTIIFTSIPMTKVGSTFNYTFCNTTELGIYIYDYNDYEGNVYVNDFEITKTGKLASSSQGMLSVGILISALLIMFFFGWLSFKFIESDEMFGVGLFFLVISLILSLYSLFLGFVLSRDFLFTSISGVQEGVFISGLLSLTGIMFICFTFLIVKVIKELKVKKTNKQYGEGYDQKTQTYKY